MLSMSFDLVTIQLCYVVAIRISTYSTTPRNRMEADFV